MDGQLLLHGALWYVIFVVSTTLHEAAHAWAALKLGDPTGYEGGQVTLDPTPHLQREPFGMVLVPLLSFALGGWMIGWASCPYDPVWAQRHPKRAAWMALAGPAANLSLVIVAGLLIRLGTLVGFFLPPQTVEITRVADPAEPAGLAPALAVAVSILFMLNLILCAFNLIPLPPLDGSGALPLVLSESSWRRYEDIISQPALSILGLLLAWRAFAYIFGPIQFLALNLLYPDIGYR